MNERFVAAAAAPRPLTGVLVTFAVLTAILAAIGVYGLLAWTVSDRRRELAIRLALGAQPGALARLVTAQGLMLALLGVVLGLVVAQFAGGLLRDVLFETRPTDMLALTTAAGVVVLAAATACLAPALRATRVSPTEGVKSELVNRRPHAAFRLKPEATLTTKNPNAALFRGSVASGFSRKAAAAARSCRSSSDDFERHGPLDRLGSCRLEADPKHVAARGQSCGADGESDRLTARSTGLNDAPFLEA
jgi:hypothetical protein